MAIETLTGADFNSKYMLSQEYTQLAQPQEVEDDTSFLEDFSTSLPAAFQMENSVGSYLADETKNTTNDVEEGYNVFDDIGGYEDNADAFIGVRNSQRAQAIKANIDRENQLKGIIASSGGGGIAASMVASMFDPVDWAIVGATGGIGILGKAGKLVKVGAEATIATLATETVMQATQETRTMQDSLLNIAAAPAMLGVVKTGQMVMRIGGKAGIPKSVDIDKAGDEIFDNISEGYNPQATPTVNLKNAGAAETLAVQFGEETKLAKTHWARSNEFEGSVLGDEVTAGEKVGSKAFGWQARLTPIGRMVGSSSQVAREYVHGFLENGFVTKGNVEGVAKEVSAETFINRKQGMLIAATEQSSSRNYLNAVKDGETMTAADFQKEVGKAMSNNDIHTNKHIQQTAQEFREVLDRLKVEAQEVGLLDKDIEDVVGAESYFSRVYNRKALRENSDEFRDLVQNNFAQAAEEIKSRAVAKDETLTSKGLGMTEDELLEGKVNLKATRKQIDTEIDLRYQDKLEELDDVVKGSPEDKALKLEAMDEYYDEVVKDFSDTDEYLAILEVKEKSFRRAKQLEGKQKILSETLVDLKRTVNEDFGISTDMNEFRKAAQRVEQNILGDGMFKPSSVEVTGFSQNVANSLKKRVLQLSDNELEKFLEKDASFVLRRNVMSLTPQIEIMKKQMKLFPDAKPDLEMTSVKNSIKEDYQEKLYLLDKENIVDVVKSGKFLREDMENLLGKRVWQEVQAVTVHPLWKAGILDDSMKLKKGVTEEDIRKVLTDTPKMNKVLGDWGKKYTKHMNSDLEDLEATRQLLLGEQRYQTDPNTFWNKSLRNLRSVNYMSMLGGVTLSSLTDISRHGMANGLRGYKPFFKAKNWNRFKDTLATKEATQLGIVSELVLNKRASELADLSEGVYETGAVERMMNKTTNGFSKYTGMSYWNDLNKQISTGVTQDIILEAAEVVGKGGKLEENLKVRLAENGLDEDLLKRINDQAKKHGETVDGLRLGGATKWEDPELVDVYSGVLRKQADMAVISPSVGDKPLWASSSEFAKSVFQFQSFMFAATNRQVLAGASHNGKRMLPWMGVQLALGLMVTDLKDTVKGKEPRDWDKEFTSNTLEIVDRSGIIPLFSYASKAGQAFGITSRNRYEEQNAVGSLLGPSLGTVERSRKIVADAFAGKGYEAWSNTSKLLPYQNHPLVQLLEQTPLLEEARK